MHKIGNGHLINPASQPLQFTDDLSTSELQKRFLRCISKSNAACSSYLMNLVVKDVTWIYKYLQVTASQALAYRGENVPYCHKGLHLPSKGTPPVKTSSCTACRQAWHWTSGSLWWPAAQKWKPSSREIIITTKKKVSNLLQSKSSYQSQQEIDTRRQRSLHCFL